jgi:hypothetical protein
MTVSTRPAARDFHRAISNCQSHSASCPSAFDWNRPPLVAGFFMRGRMAGMGDDQIQKILRAGSEMKAAFEKLVSSATRDRTDDLCVAEAKFFAAFREMEAAAAGGKLSTPAHPMKYRKLRIAFSVTCVIACVLLIVLWVRSYWMADMFWNNETHRLCMTAASGYGRMIIWIGETQAVSDSPWDSIPLEHFAPLPTGIWGFKTYIQTSGLKAVGLQAPHWFFFGTLALIAYLPWASWRFSLRTILIAMTLIAFMLGLAVWAA